MPSANLTYRKLDLWAPDTNQEIGKWAMNWPVSKGYRKTLNKVVFTWLHSIVKGYQPPGCWLTYRDIAKDVKLCRKTVARAVRWWADRGVLYIDHQFHGETQGHKPSLLLLHPRWYDDQALDSIAADGKRERSTATKYQHIAKGNRDAISTILGDDIAF